MHTNVQDKLDAYKTVRRAYIWAVLMMFGLVVVTFIPNISSLSVAMTWVLRAAVAVFGALFLIPTVKYSLLVNRLRNENKIFE